MRYSFYRTVKKGQVQINGRIYRPDENFMPYDGRLDGHRFLFILYRGQESLAALWGTEEAAKDPEMPCHRTTGICGYGPEEVDGHFPWYFWSSE